MFALEFYIKLSYAQLKITLIYLNLILFPLPLFKITIIDSKSSLLKAAAKQGPAVLVVPVLIP